MSLRHGEACPTTTRRFSERRARVQHVHAQAMDRSRSQSRRKAQDSGVVIISNFDRKPFEAAMTGIYDKVMAEPALKQLVDRIRQVQ